MKVCIARHGYTNYNDLHLNNDDPSVDVYLTEKGIIQAEALAKQLQSVPFERIYISGLSRTRQTADIINKLHDVHIEVDSRLNDNRTGFEGKSYQEYDAALAAASDISTYVGPGRGAESLASVRARVRALLDELRGKSYDTVLIVTHLCILQNIIGVLQELSFEESDAIRVGHGTFTTLEL